MDFKFDSSYILYALGAILGISTFVYFAQELILNLSPTTKSILLFLSFGLFFALGNYSETSVLDVSYYVLSAASYIVFLVFTLGKFDFTPNQTFIALGASSLLFIGLGYFVKEKEFDIGKKTMKKVLGAILVLAAVFLVFDVLGAQPEYSISTDETVDLDMDGTSVGSLQVSNGFMFSRDIDLPDYQACVLAPGMDLESDTVYTRFEGSDYRNMVYGRSSRQYDLVVSPSGFLRENNLSEMSGFSVEVADECPESSEERKIVLYRSDVSTGYEVMRPKY